MKLELKNIHKFYGKIEVLQGVYFVANSGDIVGFIGPNGAGKSTMFRILTGLASTNTGEIFFNGKPVIPTSNDWKRKLGYLAEHNPLYLDMYVVQFLQHVCNLHGLDSQDRRIREVLDEIELDAVKSYKIRHLSKGYRQRVGIAQAILNNPNILVLDEPTSGLDPNQMEGVRNLVRRLSRDRIIILSSHILSEIEEVCNKIVMINKGQIIDQFEGGVFAKEQNNIRVVFDRVVNPLFFSELGNVHPIEDNKMALLIELNKPEHRLLIFDIAVEKGIRISEMVSMKNALRDRFTTLTS